MKQPFVFFFGLVAIAAILIYAEIKGFFKTVNINSDSPGKVVTGNVTDISIPSNEPTVATPETPTPEPETPTKKDGVIFVFAGESNAGCQVANLNANSNELGERGKVLILNNNSLTFEPLNISGNNSLGQANVPSNSHGWDLQLANLCDNGSYEKVFLVSVAQGGSLIGQYNDTNADGNYRGKLVERCNAAFNAVRALGLNPVVNIVYSQGINDILLGTTASNWKIGTIQHLGLFSELFVNYKMVMTNFAHFPQYNTAMNEIASSNASVKVLDTSGLSLQDEYHWGYNAQKIIITQAVSLLKAM